VLLSIDAWLAGQRLPLEHAGLSARRWRRQRRMKVMLGISGGVDSSVAALLLQQAGHEVEGLFMQNWEEDDRSGPCTTDADRKDAVAVCGRLGIPFHARNFAGRILGRRVRALPGRISRGRTPNPDVLCNREIKFKTFLDEARALGADKIATGHYARVDFHDGRYRLLRAWTPPRTRPISCMRWASSSWPPRCSRSARSRSRACASWPAKPPAHACEEGFHRHLLYRRARFPQLSRAVHPGPPGEMRTPDGESSASTRA
jgi:tRNA-specific 2-thiouridylase